jgi:hypothetical protein
MQWGKIAAATKPITQMLQSIQHSCAQQARAGLCKMGDQGDTCRPKLTTEPSRAEGFVRETLSENSPYTSEICTPAFSKNTHDRHRTAAKVFAAIACPIGLLKSAGVRRDEVGDPPTHLQASGRYDVNLKGLDN